MKKIALLFFFGCAGSFAKFTRTPFEGIRPAGMGNAFTAIADDLNALFYNPAGLARIGSTHLDLIDLTLGVDNKDTLDRLGNAVLKSDTAHLVRNTAETMSLGLNLSFLTKYFGIALYDRVHGAFDTSAISALSSFNPLAPDFTILQKAVDVFMVNDIGLITGFGVPFGNYFSWGFSLRAIQRTAIDAYLTATDLLQNLQIGQTDMMAQMYGQLYRLAGVGYGLGLNTGALIRVPLATNSPQLFLSAVVEDVGQTTFRNIGILPVPAPIRPTYVAGSALRYTLGSKMLLNIALDLRTQFIPVHFMRTFNFGVELQHSAFGLRTGLHDGYISYGASLRLAPHTKIEAASYGIEMGRNLWEKMQRVYLLRVVVGFNAI